MNIVITCALPVEFNEARNQFGLKEITTKKDSPRIGIKDNITIICTGIGKLNTVISLFKYLADNKPGIVIDSGTCGSLCSEIKISDIVVSNNCRDYFNINNPNKLYSYKKETIESLIPSIIVSDYIMASLEESIISDNFKRVLLDKGASLVSWETSSVFAVCDNLGIPYVSIRGVTDMCNGNTYRDFKLNKHEVCKKLYNSVKTICISI